MKINNNLKQYRIQNHLSQSKIAKMVGINETHYQKIEYGSISPSIKVAILITYKSRKFIFPSSGCNYWKGKAQS